MFQIRIFSMKNSSPRLEQQNLLVDSEMHAVLSTTPPLFLKNLPNLFIFINSKEKSGKTQKT